MTERVSRLRFGPLFSVALLVAAAVPPALAAQQQLGSEKDADEITRNTVLVNKFRDGAKPDPVKDKKLIEAIARNYIFRVTWPTIQKDKSESGMAGVHSRLKELMEHKATQSGENKEFMKLLAPELVACLKQVLALDLKSNYQAVTNAALMLPVVAKCRQPAIDDFLMELTAADKSGKPLV